MTGSDVEATELFTTRLFGFWGVVPTQRPWEVTKVTVSGLGPQEQALGVTMGKVLLLHLIRKDIANGLGRCQRFRNLRRKHSAF